MWASICVLAKGNLRWLGLTWKHLLMIRSFGLYCATFLQTPVAPWISTKLQNSPPAEGNGLDICESMSTGQGKHFRTWALSHFLHLFFTVQAKKILRSEFPNIYAVFGGGDDLFVIGPWNEVLEFALSLRRAFRHYADDALTFSAGVCLAKPRDHILTKARETGDELESAKEQPAYGRHCGRDQIQALGVTCAWDDFARLLDRAKQVTAWLESGEIPSQFLHQALELHHRWAEARRSFADRETADSVRYRPLLYYQAQRNLSPGAASNWAHSLLHRPSDWPEVDFIIRYAMLASKRGREES